GEEALGMKELTLNVQGSTLNCTIHELSLDFFKYVARDPWWVMQYGKLKSVGREPKTAGNRLSGGTDGEN
ncbi:MAG: hypothetical protein SVR04_17620, partial [Spirochaetota bacterium]|nr:hypothetical protein [Spirochaetota bacterium]